MNLTSINIFMSFLPYTKRSNHRNLKILILLYSKFFLLLAYMCVLAILASFPDIFHTIRTLYLHCINQPHVQWIRPNVEVLGCLLVEVTAVGALVLSGGTYEEGQNASVAEDLLAEVGYPRVVCYLEADSTIKIVFPKSLVLF